MQQAEAVTNLMLLRLVALGRVQLRKQDEQAPLLVDATFEVLRKKVGTVY